MVRVLTIVLMVVLVGPCLGADPGTWFEERFDTYPVGSLAKQGAWTGTDNAFQVQETFAKSGKAMAGDYLRMGTGQVAIDVKSTGNLNFIEMDVAMDAVRGFGAPGTPLVVISVLSPLGAEITRLSLADRQLKLNLANHEVAVILDGVPARKWIHVGLLINLSAMSIDACVDGEVVLRGRWLMSRADQIAKITFSDWIYGYAFYKSEAYVDNIVCRSWTGRAAGAIGRSGGWERQQVSSPFVMYDDEAKLYRMFYSGTAGGNIGDACWSIWHIGTATSTNGIGFGRITPRSDPVLFSTRFLEGDILNPDDIAKRFDSVWATGPCVIKDGKQYRMWYTGWCGQVEHNPDGTDNKVNYRIGYATSADGVRWTKSPGSAEAGSTLGLGPRDSADAKAVGEPWVIKDKGLYRMWYEGFDGSTWRILYATSTDGLKWTRKGVVLEPGAAGDLDALGVRYPVVITRNGRHELWYQGRSAGPQVYHVMRAVSSDGVTWKKVHGEVILAPSDPLDSDERLYVDSVIPQPDGSCRIYYAKEDYSTGYTSLGFVDEKRFSGYTEVVNP